MIRVFEGAVFNGGCVQGREPHERGVLSIVPCESFVGCRCSSLQDDAQSQFAMKPPNGSFVFSFL